jgi:hypothetical protein
LGWQAGSGINYILLGCLLGAVGSQQKSGRFIFYCFGKPYRAEPRLVGRVPVAEFNQVVSRDKYLRFTSKPWMIPAAKPSYSHSSGVAKACGIRQQPGTR